MIELLIGEGAELDYTESLRWYAEHSQQAAEGFDAEFARVLEAIADDPHRYPFCDDRHRFSLLKRYPFQVIFREVPGSHIQIVAVAHTSRYPGYWWKRSRS